jgi:hypothetical protein
LRETGGASPYWKLNKSSKVQEIVQIQIKNRTEQGGGNSGNKEREKEKKSYYKPDPS